MGQACCQDTSSSVVEYPLATVNTAAAGEAPPVEEKEKEAISVPAAAVEKTPPTPMGEAVHGVVTVTFKDQESGKETDFALTETPFGMRYESGLMPVMIKEFLPNSHAQSIGVPLNTPLVKVNGVEMEQMEAGEDAEVTKAKFEKIDKAVKDASAAAFGVTMVFKDIENGAETVVTLREVPFGMSYTTGLGPVKIRAFLPDSYAQKCGVPLNTPLVKINGLDLEKASFAQVDKAIKDASKSLKK